MTPQKRLLDLVFALLLIVLLGPVLLGLVLWLLVREGRPVFYVAERMKGVDRPFMLWKLRTMAVADADSGVSGGDKTVRITPTGAWLRSKRLDEFPQLEAMDDLERQLQVDIDEIGARWSEKAQAIETLEIGLERNDVAMTDVRLVWVPVSG